MIGYAQAKRVRTATIRPERNPIETAFRCPGNDRPGNRAFANVSAATDACREARERFAIAPSPLEPAIMAEHGTGLE